MLHHPQEGQKTYPKISKAQRLKQIDVLYQSQMKRIYNENTQIINKDKDKQKDKDKDKEKEEQQKKDKKTFQFSILPQVNSTKQLLKDDGNNEDELNIKTKNYNNIVNNMDTKNMEDQKIKAQSTRTIDILRRQVQNKQLKIRQISFKCQNLIQKLKNYLQPAQLQKQLQIIRQFTNKSIKIQNIYKTKNQQNLLKLKLQITNLFQQFEIPKQQINIINQLTNENDIYLLMIKKLKNKLKSFKNKQQQLTFQIQKDKILNQKYQQRIHYLMEINQLLKLSQNKLKNKITTLRKQLNQFLQKFKNKQTQIQLKQNQLFKFKKQYQQLHLIHQKFNYESKNLILQKNQQKKIFQLKQKQMKSMISNSLLQKKKLQNLLQQKQIQIQQFLMSQKFLQQQNQKINRQFVRWKQRYQWLQKQKQNNLKQFQFQKSQLNTQFLTYKTDHNQQIYMSCKTQADQAIKKVQQYQTAYQKIIIQLQQQRKTNILKIQQTHHISQTSQKQWLQKIKRIQQIKQQQLIQLATDHQIRQKQIKQQYQKRQILLSQEMQARMKALLAQSQKRATEKLIQLQNQNDQLRKQIENLNKVIQTKQSLMVMINSKKSVLSN